MIIAGAHENIPSGVADWPHCCDFKGDTCDNLPWFAMLLEAQNRRKMPHFIAACGWALRRLNLKPEIDGLSPARVCLFSHVDVGDAFQFLNHMLRRGYQVDMV